MPSTLRELPRRCRSLRVEPVRSPIPNRPGECQADTGRKSGVMVVVVLLPPVQTRRARRSGSPAPLLKLLLLVPMCLDALLFPPRLCCRFRADIRHPLAGGPSPTRGAFPTWSLAAISANTGMTDRASQCTPHPSLTCPVTWCDIAHRAERSIGGHRALTCAGRPGHGPETAAMPRRSWRVRSRTRQEPIRCQPHSISHALVRSYGFVRYCRNLATFLFPAARRDGDAKAILPATGDCGRSRQSGGWFCSARTVRLARHWRFSPAIPRLACRSAAENCAQRSRLAPEWAANRNR
jgi:hypothetical protein